VRVESQLLERYLRLEQTMTRICVYNFTISVEAKLIDTLHWAIAPRLLGSGEHLSRALDRY